MVTASEGWLWLDVIVILIIILFAFVLLGEERIQPRKNKPGWFSPWRGQKSDWSDTDANPIAPGNPDAGPLGGILWALSQVKRRRAK